MSPFMGMDAVKSHFSRTRRPTPSPSFPMTRPMGPVRLQPVHHFAAHVGTDKPETFFFQLLNGGRQIGHLRHRGVIQGTCRGTWPPLPSGPTALRLGMMTPWAPARLAVRIMAPRLWGSSMLSSRKIKGGSPFLSCDLQNVLHVGVLIGCRIGDDALMLAGLGHLIQPLLCHVADDQVSCFLASRTMERTGPSWQPSWTNSLSMVFPAAERLHHGIPSLDGQFFISHVCSSSFLFRYPS